MDGAAIYDIGTNRYLDVQYLPEDAMGRLRERLEKLGVKNAIYCDMGYGWNYSWYRQDNGKVKELFSTPGKYTTNWLTFYKE